MNNVWLQTLYWLTQNYADHIVGVFLFGVGLGFLIRGFGR